MGRYKYTPDVIREEELDSLLTEIRELALKIDHPVARGQLHEAIAEFKNEVNNIEGGYRDIEQ